MLRLWKLNKLIQPTNYKILGKLAIDLEAEFGSRFDNIDNEAHEQSIS